MKQFRVGLFRIGLVVVVQVVLLGFGGGQVEAAWPGYNGKIAFNAVFNGGNNTVYEIASPTVFTQLVSMSGSSSRPVYSADGSWLLFCRYDGSDSATREIYSMAADGSQLKRLTNNAFNDDVASWSPDGQKIIFQSNRDGNNELYAMDADGQNTVRLTNNAASDTSGNFSPDGQYIIFTSNRSGGVSEAFRMDKDGNNVIQLTSSGVPHTSPHYSPDGQKIVWFGPIATGQPNQIWVMNADGSNHIQLTSYVSPLGANYPTWSPDGTKILFSRRAIPLDAASVDLFTINADGSNLQQISQGIAVTTIPDWQPLANKAPVLETKKLSLLSGQSGVAAILTGATDEQALSPTHTSITHHPSHGTAVLTDGVINYTAQAGYAGLDSVGYQVCDSFMLDQKCQTATLAIEIKPVVEEVKVGASLIDEVGRVAATLVRPTFSGKTTPLSVVRVEIHSDPIVLTTTADSQGNWSVTPSSPLPPGEHTVYISSTLNGQTTQLDSFVLGIEATIPQTGASYWWWRGVGVVVLVLGLGLFMRRKLAISL